MVKYSQILCKQALSTSGLPDLDYSLNPYFGCEHGCIFCYSPSVFRNKKIAEDWGEFVKAKINIPEVLSKQISKIPKGVVGISTVTDPYQPLEAELCLTRRCIEILSEKEFPVSIQTKSDLVLRDKDLIKGKGFDLGVTLITLDSQLMKELGPRASAPEALIQVLEEFTKQGLHTWIFFGPIIPEINDDEETVTQIARIAKKTNSTIIYDKLNLKRYVLDSMEAFLKRNKQDFERIKMALSKNSEYWNKIQTRINQICKREDIKFRYAF